MKFMQRLFLTPLVPTPFVAGQTFALNLAKWQCFYFAFFSFLSLSAPFSLTSSLAVLSFFSFSIFSSFCFFFVLFCVCVLLLLFFAVSCTTISLRFRGELILHFRSFNCILHHPHPSSQPPFLLLLQHIVVAAVVDSKWREVVFAIACFARKFIWS